MNDIDVEVGNIFGQCLPPIKPRPERNQISPETRTEVRHKPSNWPELQLGPAVAFSLPNNDGKTVEGFFQLSGSIMPNPLEGAALVQFAPESDAQMTGSCSVSIFPVEKYTLAASDEDRAQLVLDYCSPFVYDEALAKRFLRECTDIKAKLFEPGPNSPPQPSLVRDFESMRAFERQLEELTNIPAREIRELGLWQLGGLPVNNENDNRVYIVGKLPREADSVAWVLRYEPTTGSWEATSMSWHVRAGFENYTNEYRFKVLPGLPEWSPADYEKLDEIVNYVSAA